MKRPGVMVNLSFAHQAAAAAALPVEGVGLVRTEFLFLERGVHPSLLRRRLGDDGFVSLLADHYARIVDLFAPRPVTIRTSDLKTHEYRELEGGAEFEPHELNPALGWRGAARYEGPDSTFRLELEAVAAVADRGLSNLRIMLPFVRTVEEVDHARSLIRDAGLLDGVPVELWVMVETPAAMLLAREIADRCEGLCLGTNDLNQLLLAADRDEERFDYLLDEVSTPMLRAVEFVADAAHRAGVKVSVCGDLVSRSERLLRRCAELDFDAVSVPMSAVTEVRERLTAVPL